jgi:hypothetical protein
MDLDVNIEDIEFPDEEQIIQDRREVETLLDKRGRFESMEHFNIIGIYCCCEKPLYLLYYVLDKNVCWRSVQGV